MSKNNTYRIPVLYTMYGYVEVKAENIDEACDLVMAGELPVKADYLEGSFEIDYEGLPDQNPGAKF